MKEKKQVLTPCKNALKRSLAKTLYVSRHQRRKEKRDGLLQLLFIDNN